jgi:PIN domain nuclease of toxin-antitoxin system
MKILLDTQIALWAWVDPGKLPQTIRNGLTSPAHQIFFSQVSTWEIQIKFALGKLPLPERPEKWLAAALQDSGFNYLTIQDSAIFFLDRLPAFHRDPFDRLLIAHGITGAFQLATVDPVIMQYPVPLMN